MAADRRVGVGQTGKSSEGIYGLNHVKEGDVSKLPFYRNRPRYNYCDEGDF